MESTTDCPACHKASKDPRVSPCDHGFCLGCLEQLVDPRLLPCNHTYCLNCLEMLKKRRARIQCQVCKSLHRVPEEGVKGFNNEHNEINKKTRNCWRSKEFIEDFLNEFTQPDDDDEERTFTRKALKQLVEIYDGYSDKKCNNLECKRRNRRLSIKCPDCWVSYCSKKCRDNDYDNGHQRDCDDILYFKEVVRELNRRRHIIPKYSAQLSWIVSQHDSHSCSKCRKRLPKKELKVCSACATARYCSKKCQVKDWKRKHKNDCVNMRGLRDLLYRDNPYDIPEDENLSDEQIDQHIRIYRLFGDQPRKDYPQGRDFGNLFGLTDEEWDSCIVVGRDVASILCT